MIRLGVIGLGTIFSVQAQALARLEELYRVTAVCDVLPEKRRLFEKQTAGALPGEAPSVYRDSEDVFSDPHVDAVLIATPPATHYALAMEGLRHGKHLLLEKPAVLAMEQLDALYAAAEARHRILHIAYHASFARDLAWFLSHSDGLALGEITQIECGFYDPYMESGRILPGKIPLGGCFIDSGVNALSVCARLTDLSGYRLTGKNVLTSPEAEDLVYHADHTFEKDGCRILLHTGWDLGLNRKTTTLSFSGTDRKLLLDHSRQSAVLLHGAERTTLYRYDKTERLLTHYLGVFRDFDRAYRRSQSNKDASLLIHRLLFEG